MRWLQHGLMLTCLIAASNDGWPQAQIGKTGGGTIDGQEQAGSLSAVPPAVGTAVAVAIGSALAIAASDNPSGTGTSTITATVTTARPR